jgi:iron complex outermembrane receptor protein
LDFVAGISYDQNAVLRADFTNTSAPTVLLSNPDTPSVDAWNWQGAAILDYSRTGTAYANVSSRTRFATLFERYSTRFGARAANPNLDSERATNYELGANDIFGDVKVSGALFYSDIQDSIQNVFFGANGNNSIVGINADGESYGLELSADWDVTRTLRVGGNYTTSSAISITSKRRSGSHRSRESITRAYSPRRPSPQRPLTSRRARRPTRHSSTRPGRRRASWP